jgi:hypothetical protein
MFPVNLTTQSSSSDTAPIGDNETGVFGDPNSLAQAVQSIIQQVFDQLQASMQPEVQNNYGSQFSTPDFNPDSSPQSTLSLSGTTGDEGAPSEPSGGSRTDGTDSELENAMSQTAQSDPTLYAKTIKDAKSGNGNSLAEDELQAYKKGEISKQQCIEEVSGAQSLANQNGGGKINGKTKNDAKQALGDSYIKGGQTRAGHAILRAFETFSPVGAIVKGVSGKTSKEQPENIIQAGQATTEQRTETAMQDMDEADPDMAQKFQQDAQKGDGNAMVTDMVSLKNEEQSGQGPDTFTDQDAQILGTQVGNYGKGKVNSKESQAFTQAFGTNTLFRGSSRGAKLGEKVENGISGITQQIMSPVTDTVAGYDKLVHGDVEGAFTDFGGALKGAATDAAMVLAPEAAPELEVGELAADGAAAAGEAGTKAALDPLASASKIVDKGNDYYDHANTVMNNLGGNNQSGNNENVG